VRPRNGAEPRMHFPQACRIIGRRGPVIARRCGVARFAAWRQAGPPPTWLTTSCP